ncbi:PilN domain-containing protein [Cellvibrio japonicus]|uniref:Type 4 fimbrial biogenesis protein PilN n=1 Tax=Cellvibrio japonicus (strain Ueda107) TaxID=498211 RepID=B3PI74_CELJU|nr:PilN domain-containing protein [Cellvibrio japonicus]ACE83007.1 type 4 fimbrial biogenesis protein PilN [Cellvibrio japonicus Ueda107]QEI11119.1 PilN domain-containing protein [Cellvibrio japonicus]QEI14693.1 PilN domain-containing protein [Cellvibrio japonicus]QEI18273.1 PilN domain-containing protein [Cellvibrio japonicus]
MAKINLLPWRQAYREEKKREFLVVIGFVLGLSVLGAYLWISSVEASIDNQNSRNRLLDQEIKKLDEQVKEISELKKVRDDLLARIKVIQDLEGTRPVIVRYFDEFAKAVPDGVYVTMVDKKGSAITIEGVAESYNRVASFMRNLDASDWFASPNLTSVTAAPSEGEQASSFKMTVQTSAPADADPAAASTSTGAAK